MRPIHFRTILTLSILVHVGAAHCAPPLAGPTAIPTAPTIPVIVTPTPPAIGVTLSPQGQQYLQNRLPQYLTERVARLPSADALQQAGVSLENDALEQAWDADGRRVVPHHIGRAGVSAPPAVTVDPVAIKAAAGIARQRLGREPTATEINAAVADFDAEIARVNQALAQRRTEIATAYRSTGRFPRDLEAPILGIAPRSAEAVNPNQANRYQLQQILTKLVNSLAAEQSATPLQ